MIPARDEATRELSAKETAVLVHLLTGLSPEKAGELAHVGERTIWTWLRENEPFRRELRVRQRQAIEIATRKLASAAGKAVETLELVMGDAEAPAAARVSASRAVLDAVFRAAEHGDLTERLDELEAAQREGDTWTAP